MQIRGYLEETVPNGAPTQFFCLEENKNNEHSAILVAFLCGDPS